MTSVWEVLGAVLVSKLWKERLANLKITRFLINWFRILKCLLTTLQNASFLLTVSLCGSVLCSMGLLFCHAFVPVCFISIIPKMIDRCSIFFWKHELIDSLLQLNSVRSTLHRCILNCVFDSWCQLVDNIIKKRWNKWESRKIYVVRSHSISTYAKFSKKLLNFSW